MIYDGMWHLDIPKCQDRDGGKIEVIARNQCGEAYASTTLKINRRKDDYRSVLKHNVKREYQTPLVISVKTCGAAGNSNNLHQQSKK